VVGLLVAGVPALRCSKAVPADMKPSWFQTALKDGQMAGSIWLAFRAHHDN
jgi:hypothetical protein